nr:BMP family ABC transporter substrate-binding protein [Candidatus Cloacimonadota bacterium]
MRKSFVIILLILSLLLILSCGKKAEQTDQEKLKVGFVYIGPIGDAGWTYAHEQGHQALKQLPFVEKTTIVENVPENAEATRVITQLAEEGYNLIFTTSFGYSDPMIEVAAKYPNVKFMHCSGYKTADNVGTYFGKMYEATYLAGVAVGKLTKSNKVGIVAAHPIPEVKRHINGYARGIASVNPNAKLYVIWANSWYDPGKESDAANSLIDMGCDVIMQNMDSAAAQQAAEKRGVLSVGYNNDMSKFAPRAHITAPIWNWSVVYKYIAEQVYNKTWTNEQIYWGLDKDLIGLAPFNASVPEDIKTYVEQKKQEIVAGTLHPFA